MRLRQPVLPGRQHHGKPAQAPGHQPRRDVADKPAARHAAVRHDQRLRDVLARGVADVLARGRQLARAVLPDRDQGLLPRLRIAEVPIHYRAASHSVTTTALGRLRSTSDAWRALLGGCDAPTSRTVGRHVTEQTALVVTSISPPNAALAALADRLPRTRHPLPRHRRRGEPRRQFELSGCDFFGLTRNTQALDFRFARRVPDAPLRAQEHRLSARHPRSGAEVIVETDDDNHPQPELLGDASAATARWPSLATRAGSTSIAISATRRSGRAACRSTAVHEPAARVRRAAGRRRRLPHPAGPRRREPGRRRDLPARRCRCRSVSGATARSRWAADTWCPFNSQNTAWWRDAVPLLYLPAYCSFRMTDIWRSFVAQRIAWENGWRLLFHEPTI